jgi:hypothetical protein
MTELELIGGVVRANVVPVPFAVNCCARIALNSGASEFAVTVASEGTLTRL